MTRLFLDYIRQVILTLRQSEPLTEVKNMAGFDANKEAAAIVSIIDTSDNSRVSNGGSLTAAILLNDARKEFCKLSADESKQTIEVWKNSRHMSVVKDGNDNPIGLGRKNLNDYTVSYLSFDCPSK